MRKFLSVLCACAIMGGFSACGSDLNEEIIGTWIYYKKESTVDTDAHKLTFFEGGSCANSGENGTWSISGDTISILGDYGGQFFKHDVIVGEFEIDDDKLIISNPSVDGDICKGNIVYIRESAYQEKIANEENIAENQVEIENSKRYSAVAAAQTIYKSANSALEELKEKGIDITGFEGMLIHMPNDDKSELYDCMNYYFDNVDGSEFALYIENGICVCAVYSSSGYYGMYPLYNSANGKKYDEPSNIQSAIEIAKDIYDEQHNK